MPFPKHNVYFHSSFGSSPRFVHMDDPESGFCKEVVEDCNKKLPDSENFKIENMVNAGVTLNQVNTNILGSGFDTESFSGAISEVAKSVKSVKSKEKNED